MKRIVALFFLAAVSATIAGDVKPYPLQTCIVSDEALSPTRKPTVIVHNGQEVRVCCRECKADFKNNPEKFLKKLPAAK